MPEKNAHCPLKQNKFHAAYPWAYRLTSSLKRLLSKLLLTLRLWRMVSRLSRPPPLSRFRTGPFPSPRAEVPERRSLPNRLWLLWIHQGPQVSQRSSQGWWLKHQNKKGLHFGCRTATKLYKIYLEFLGLTKQKLEIKEAQIGFKLWIPS